MNEGINFDCRFNDLLQISPNLGRSICSVHFLCSVKFTKSISPTSVAMQILGKLPRYSYPRS